LKHPSTLNVDIGVNVKEVGNGKLGVEKAEGKRQKVEGR
jgi:hypothetical protein